MYLSLTRSLSQPASNWFETVQTSNLFDLELIQSNIALGICLCLFVCLSARHVYMRIVVATVINLQLNYDNC